MAGARDPGHVIPVADWSHTDPLWPPRCEGRGCDYAFTAADQWQVFQGHLFRTATGDLVTTRHAPPGAMWWNDWRGTGDPDLFVMLPDGSEWNIDGPSSGGGGWQRAGVPPAITVTPSILTPRYHAFLTGGVLVRC